MRGFGDYTDDDTASAIKARDWKDATDLVTESPILIDRSAFNQGVNAQYDTHISDDPVTPSLVARGPHAVATYVKAKRAQSATDDETWVEGDINPTINQFDQGDVRATTAIVMRQRKGKPGGGKGPLLSENKSLTLAAAGNDQTLFVEEPILLDGRRVDDVRVYDPPVQTLQARMGTGGNNVSVVGAVAYDEYNDRLGGEVHHALRAGTKQSTGVAISEVAGTLRSGGDGGVPSSRGEHLVVSEPVMLNFQGSKGNSVTSEDGVSFTLNAMHGHDVHAITEPTMSVRRLTPLECERLMGWPDDWTVGQADTHRYKQCGNGVASPVAQWIGEQILNIPQ